MMYDGRDCRGVAPSVMYVQFVLLLRSLRAWGLGVVLVKVAGSLYIDAGEPPIRKIHLCCAGIKNPCSPVRNGAAGKSLFFR